MLEEVVVTAQRREQRLQDVPAAISSLSGEDLSRRNLLGNADLVARVPSLSLDVQGPGESTLSIRGVGTAYGLAPAVSYYLNETPLDIRTDGGTGVPDIDFFDVDRVEVLRGPQGTLYGSSSMGGALRVLTAQPDPTGFAAKAETGVSTMDGGGTGYMGKAAVNVPLSDTPAIRFVGAYEHIPGYVDRAVPGDWFEANPDLPISDREINDADLLSGRILGLLQINDKVKITPSLWYSEIDAGGASEYFTNLPRFTTAGTYPSPAEQQGGERQRAGRGGPRVRDTDLVELGADTGRGERPRPQPADGEPRAAVRAAGRRLPDAGSFHLGQRGPDPGVPPHLAGRPASHVGGGRVLQPLRAELGRTARQRGVRHRDRPGR